MKKLTLLGILTLALTSYAQTNTPPATNVVPTTASTLWDFVTTGSNYWAAPYGTYSPSSHNAGGGVAIGYNASEVINPVVRLDYFDHKLWMGSLTAQLQPPRNFLGKIPIVPFGIAGVATPFSGDQSGQLVTIVGAGAAIKLDSLSSSKLAQHTDIVVDYEKWMGLPSNQQNQIRFGVLFKF